MGMQVVLFLQLYDELSRQSLVSDGWINEDIYLSIYLYIIYMSKRMLSKRSNAPVAAFFTWSIRLVTSWDINNVERAEWCTSRDRPSWHSSFTIFIRTPGLPDGDSRGAAIWRCDTGSVCVISLVHIVFSCLLCQPLSRHYAHIVLKEEK